MMSLWCRKVGRSNDKGRWFMDLATPGRVSWRNWLWLTIHSIYSFKWEGNTFARLIFYIEFKSYQKSLNWCFKTIKNIEEREPKVLIIFPPCLSQNSIPSNIFLNSRSTNNFDRAASRASSAHLSEAPDSQRSFLIPILTPWKASWLKNIQSFCRKMTLSGF